MEANHFNRKKTGIPPKHQRVMIKYCSIRQSAIPFPCGPASLPLRLFSRRAHAHQETTPLITNEKYECQQLERGEVCPRKLAIGKAWKWLSMPQQKTASVMRFVKLVSPLRSIHGLVSLVCCLGLGLFAHSSRADAIAHPAHITGEIQFGNSNPRILDLLNVAHPYGIFKGNSLSPAPPLNFNATEDFTAGPPPFHYDLTVEGAPLGVTPYDYNLGLSLAITQQYAPYGLTATGLQEGLTVPVDFVDCPALLDIRFVDDAGPGGLPVTITNGTITVSDVGSSITHVIAYGVHGTNWNVLVHSGSPLLFQIQYSRGADPKLDLNNYHANITIPTALSCDEVRTQKVVVPGVGSPGQITGTVAMAGETVLPHNSINAYNLNTVMVADNSFTEAFYQGGRYTFLDSTPSSGPFTLPGLIPSADMDAMFGTHGYRVWGRLQYRTGHEANFFRTPSLTGVSLTAGASVDLGNTFNFQPGYVSGQIVLNGLPDLPGDPSPFRSLLTASDGSVAPWLTGLFSSVEARGVATNAPAYQGVDVAEFDGTFTGSSYDANYELVLAGLNSQPSLWDLSRLNLYFHSTGTGTPYMVGKLLITDKLPSKVAVSPAGRTIRNLHYCFGKYSLQFQAPPGTKFFRPEVAVHGHFSGTDDLGNPVDYDVDTGLGYDLGTGVPVPFLGEPVAQAAATNTGVVRLALPHGTYTFTPYINAVAANGTVSTISLPALTNISVDCGGTNSGSPCLMLNLSDPPECATPPYVGIGGSVYSCTNLSRVVWTQGDNVEHLICENCSAFIFYLPVSSPCVDQEFTVTAYDVEGNSSSATRVIRGDHFPPTVHVPTNVVVECAGPNGAPVSYNVWADDNCDPSPTVSCIPPSGSWLPLGDTTVQCLAFDRCGNSAGGSFVVTVTTNCTPNPCLEIRCPTNAIGYACGSNCVPVYFSVWATNYCDRTNLVVVTDRLPGSCFSLGTTWVKATAYGSGQSMQCSFPVTVLPDPNCPTNQTCLALYCSTNQVLYTCGTNCVPAYYSVWAENLCNSNDISVTTYPPSGTCFPVGDHAVDAWAYGSGQTKHCSFTVSVLSDPNCTNQPPCLEIHCPTNITTYVCGSNCVPVYYNVWAENHCIPGDVDLMEQPLSGTCFPIGSTLVQCTAVDSNGLTAQCEFTVTVLPGPNCGGCSSNLLVNGSFENPGIPDGYVALYGGDTIIPGWVTLLSGVEYFDPSWTLPSSVNTGAAADGQYLLDLAPAYGLGGGIQQTFNTVPGKTYHVSFAMGTSKERGKNGSASLTAVVSDSARTEGHAFNMTADGPGIVWERKSFSFAARAGQTTLNFATGNDPATCFVNLDDVRVSDCCDNADLKIYPSVTVEWDCGILQGATSVSGPYTDVVGATSPYTVPSSDPRHFFRVR